MVSRPSSRIRTKTSSSGRYGCSFVSPAVRSYRDHPYSSPKLITCVSLQSGAIIEYLLDNYDTKHLVSFPSSSPLERALVAQYSFFQATFQGPNISNGFYFARNPNPAARKRFVDESIRVLGVLEGELENKEWLVGGKLSAADLAFLPYTWSMPVCY